MQSIVAEKKAPGKSVGNSSEEVAARKRRISELRGHFIDSGMDDRAIADRIAPEVGVKPATVLTEIRKRVKKGRLPENPNNRQKEDVFFKAKGPPIAQEAATQQPLPREKSRAEQLIDMMESRIAETGQALVELAARLGKPKR